MIQPSACQTLRRSFTLALIFLGAFTATHATHGQSVGGGAIQVGQTGPCVNPVQRLVIAQQIQQNLKMMGPGGAGQVTASGIKKYSFYPHAGILWEDIFPNNFVDLDTTTNIIDYNGTRYTYDGHQGIDSGVPTFGHQSRNVPIFAALDGTVVAAHDGEPDMNTVWNNQAANFVVLDHGSGHRTMYFHMRSNSVSVTIGQSIKAGQQIGMMASSGISTGPHLHFETQTNGVFLEPFAGPQRAGESLWEDQIPFRSNLYMRTFVLSPDDLSTWAGPPIDTQRSGTIEAGVGNTTVRFWTVLQNLPANSQYKVRFKRPDGTVAFDSGDRGLNSGFFRWSYWFFNWSVNLNVTGNWEVEYYVNGALQVSAPLLVVTQGTPTQNRPPLPVGAAAFEPVSPTPEDPVICRVTDPYRPINDPDYDIVQYIYQWRVNGSIVRSVTNAARSDMIPWGLVSNGDNLACTVSTFDGTELGGATQASVVIAGGPSPTVVSTLAGNGSNLGDNIPVVESRFAGIRGLALDDNDNIYVSDPAGDRVRVINATNLTISTVAGTGTGGFSGDGGPANLAEINRPRGISVDKFRNRLVIPDRDNERVRLVDLTTGTISTLAGIGATGNSGDGGPAGAAELNEPFGSAVRLDGTIFFTDRSNHSIRRVDGNGIISTVAGTGSPGYSGDGGPANAAQLRNPGGITFDQFGNLIFADSGNHRIRRIELQNGVISTIAGTGSRGYIGDGGLAIDAQLNQPGFLTYGPDGDLYFTDEVNHVIRRIDNDTGIIRTYAGNGVAGFSGDGGDALAASFNRPSALEFDTLGNLLVADRNNQRIRKIQILPSSTFDFQNLQPGHSIPLFTNNYLFHFEAAAGGVVPWTLVESNVLEVVPGTGSLVTTQSFDAFHLHAEFRTLNNGQNGNSGIFLQGRYEVQIFNSFGKSVLDANDCGAIWGQTPPPTNACLAPGEWQTYEITFHPPQWNHTNKVRNARVTVALNGILLHKDVEIPSSTQAGNLETNSLGPILLQDNGSSVQFRNIVVTPFDTAPLFDWARRAGGPTTNSVTATSDVLGGISADGMGSIYVAGSINSAADFGTNNIATVAESDAFVAKYGINGDVQWVNRGGGNLSDQFQDVAATPDGGVVAVGFIEGNANFSGTNLANRGGRDIVIVKYDGSGALQWAQSVGDSGNDQANGVTVEANGDILVTGGFSLTNKFGPGETVIAAGSVGRQDIFFAKYRPDGSIIWARSAGGILDDVGNDLVTDGQGGAYVVGKVGSSASFGPIPVQGAGNQESFITHIDGGGAFRWLRNSETFGSASEADSIARSPDGGLFVSGEFINLTIGGFTNRANGIVDGYLLRTTPSGDISWVRTMGGAGFDGTGKTAVATDRQGNAYLAMEYGFQLNANATNANFSATTVPQRTLIGTDAAVARYGADGDFHWVRDFGGNGSDQPAAIASDPAGNVFVGGNFFGTSHLGPFSISGPTSYDVFVARLQSTQTQLPVGQWRFDDMMPPVVRDSAGGFNGSLSSTGAVFVAGGFSTNAVSLSRATNGYVSFGNVPITGRDPFTISVAIRLVPGDTNHMAVLSKHDTQFGRGFIFGLNGMGTNHVPGRAYFTESGRYEDALFSQVDVNDGKWHTLLVTYEPFGRKAFYVDGVFQGFAAAGLIPQVNTPLVAGGLSTGGMPVGAYEGLLDELVIYRRVLNPNEIAVQAIYPDEAIETFILPEFAWARQIIGSTNLQSEAVARDSQGNVYVTGWFQGQADFGSNNVITSSGFADMFLAKYDNDGNLLWLKQGGGSQGYDGGTDLVVDSQDNIIVVGNYGRTAFFEGLALINGGFGGFGGGSILFGRGGFVAKYTPDGTISLLKDGWGNISGVDVDSGDSIYIAGTGRLNNVIEGRPLLSFGRNDMWIAKYTAFGTLAWAINYGSGGDESIADIRLDQADDIYIGGQYDATMTIGSQTLNLSGAPANPRLPFLIKLNPGTGAPIWALRGNGTAFGNVQSIDIDSLNRPNIVGSFFSSLNFGAIRLTNTVTSGYRAVFSANGTPVNGLPYHDDTKGIAINGNDNIYLWGDFNGNEPVGTNLLSSIGGQDTVLLKVNDAGTNQLIRQVRSTDDDFAATGKGVTVDPRGNVFVTGHSTATNNNSIAFGQLSTPPSLLASAWLAKIPSEVQILRSPTDLVATNLDTTFFRVMPGGEFPFTYHWFHNGTNAIPGANSAILRLTNLALALPGSYHVIVSNSAGHAISQPAQLSLALPPVILTQPQNVTVARNRTTTFGVQVGGVGPFDYQWFFAGTNSLPDATNANFIVSNISTNDEGAYHVVITNRFGTTVSEAAQLTTFPEGVLPEIITQAAGATNPVGSFISFNVTAGGQNPLFYQWYRNGAALAGRTQPFLQLFNLQLPNTGNYTVIVTNLVGSVTSTVARLEVFLPVAPVITNQPQSQAALVGANTSFSVGVSGSPVLRYQWKRNNSDIPGATDPVLNLSNIQLGNAGNYEVQVFNDAGAAASTPVTLTVQQPPFIVTQPQTITVSNAQPTTLVSVIGGSPPPAIQWFRDGVLLQDGTEYLGVRNATLSVLSAGVSDIGSYFVTATNAAGAVTSAPAALILNFPPQILTQPVSVDRPAGSNHTFSIIVTGAPPMTLQWRFMGQPIPDAITDLLSITNLGRANSGFYDVVVGNASGSLTSSNARLRVIIPQRINVPTVDSNRFRFTFGESDGSALVATNLPPFEVQLTTNFNSWHSFTNPAIFTNGQLSFEDILPPALQRRYYRIIEP
jgi:hypothetical protein